MRRCRLVLMVIILVITLGGCIVIPMSEYYDIPAEDVVSVQFYDLRDERLEQSPGFHKLYEPVFTVPQENTAAFLKDFSQLEFKDTIVITIAAIDPSFSYGDWVVRINFTDGQYTLYSCGGYGESFDAEDALVSSTHFDCDRAELEALVRKYYPQDKPSEQDQLERFSYVEDFARYRADPGTKMSGFVNSREVVILVSSQAVELAKQECTVEYDTVSVAYDPTSHIYRISLFKKDTPGGGQIVYIDHNGITQLIVSVE